jgi:hypothetical protein
MARYLLGLFLSVIFSTSSYAKVIVADWLPSQTEIRTVEMDANSSYSYGISDLMVGDKLEVRVRSNPSVEVDLKTDYEFKGSEQKSDSPFILGFDRVVQSDGTTLITASIQQPDHHNLILHNPTDNKVTAVIWIYSNRKVSDKARKEIEQVHEAFMSQLHELFEFPEITLFFEACDGQINAEFRYWENSIHVCSPLIAVINKEKFPLATMGILFHELGHALLYYWGQPDWRNEESADSFGVNLALHFNELGPRIINDWLGFYQYMHNTNYQNEIKSALDGDPHMLSIQRIKKIQSWMQEQDDFLKRWNRLMYRHMTTKALNSILKNPTINDDISEIKRELKAR